MPQHGTLPSWQHKAIQTTVALVIAAVLVGIVVALMGRNPFVVLSHLFISPLTDKFRLADAMARSCPLILCGLSVAIAFRCQAWNIGAAGQYLTGAIAATAVGVTLTQAPGWLLIVGLLAASTTAGALYALPAILLENRRGVPLVLSTIMLNFVAINLVSYLTQGPLRGSDPAAAQTDPIAPQAYLSPLVQGTDLHIGFILAITLCVLTWLVMNRSTAGFAIRVVGLNPTAALWSGIHVDRVKVGVMLLSGACAGLAGGLQIAGVARVLNIQASEEFGYVGIAVALLARLNPMAVPVAAMLFGVLDIGAQQVEQEPALAVPAELSMAIKGVIVLTLLVLGSRALTRRPVNATRTREAIA